MKLHRPSEIEASRDRSPIFVEDVDRQPMVTDANPGLLRANVVTFNNGARNKLHHHGADQLLVVTAGEGIVATENERLEVRTGDVIHIPAGERHWHGARPGQTFSHITILTPGEMVIDET